MSCSKCKWSCLCKSCKTPCAYRIICPKERIEHCSLFSEELTEECQSIATWQDVMRRSPRAANLIYVDFQSQHIKKKDLPQKKDHNCCKYHV